MLLEQSDPRRLHTFVDTGLEPQRTTTCHQFSEGYKQQDNILKARVIVYALQNGVW
jgi:hypothetical protein